MADLKPVTGEIYYLTSVVLTALNTRVALIPRNKFRGYIIGRAAGTLG
jgi:hypothetical protein